MHFNNNWQSVYAVGSPSPRAQKLSIGLDVSLPSSSVACGRPIGFNGRRNRFQIMETRKTLTGDTCELLVSGRIDGEGANQLEMEILAAIRGNSRTIYVNLSQATFLCSAGLRA